ncbi:tRNA (guanosine(46)-N7)-methyltransferase TrmB [Devosia sp. YIM 151766]|uniref:tRNA (guanosine(46)-N7)-methyltransferase TrmB n=1 Tax=Devosia sp. YIM 151766 TaxID=3017325 RepID=UPI00255C5109|nr:tRNA (guanosine(46)-N7)-methyltransferase TrmB [Devosia sp. YIM 151766]WIY52887.1 tRNA (guanosine(46)-N7)-methyltransferase TrmB [Devosia sp. YIM 151766]
MSDHELPKTRSGEPRAFFGRRSGKTLHGGQRALVDDLLPQVEIRLEGELDPKTLFPDARRFVIEIGYGGGEHLARKAAEEPETGFIGCEVFTGGIGKMVGAIEAGALANVRLFTDDALKLLTVLPAGSIDAVYLLYPDPWPKTRHHKRRFVSPTTLAELARVIRPGGLFYFATDIEDYANWTLAHIVRAPEFAFNPDAPGSWHLPYPGWQPTRYEQKARREGRMTSFYFRFERSVAEAQP